MTLARRLAAEFAGTALLLAVVVGSAIMGERLAAGNAAITLLANSLATGLGLFVLIVVFTPVSGAHATKQRNSAIVAAAVAAFIAAAYWFTSSTSFANPAVTLARALTPTFTGIVPTDVPPFIGAQCVGALIAVIFVQYVTRQPSPVASPPSPPQGSAHLPNQDAQSRRAAVGRTP